MNRPPRISALGDILLYEMYRELTIEGSEYAYAGYFVKNSFKSRLSQTYVERCLQYLKNKSLVTSVEDNGGDEYYGLTDQGIELIEDAIENETPIVAAWEQNGIDGFILASQTKRPEAEIETAATNGERWEPIKIERTSATYLEALRAVEETIAQVGGSNGYPTESEDERNSILATLSTGLQALKEKTIVRRSIEILLIAPLGFLKNKFPEALIGVAAEKALDLVLKLCGLG